MKLYKIWRITHNVNKPVPKYCSYVIEENGNWAYPLHEIISTMASRWYRDDFVSINLAKLQENTKYLNEIADSNEHYEIREQERELL
jgi:hypothetical protein